jgi:preprotein translocase subunit YajC
MQRQRKDQQKMLANLQNGDVVLTNGGIIGTIIWLSEESVILRVKPDNLKLQITRSSVAGLAPENLK